MNDRSGRAPGARQRRPLRLLAPLAALLAVLAPAGCGLGAGAGPRDVQVVVTRDFGARELGRARAAKASGGETAMRLLQRNFRVQTRYGGGFVQSIDGLAGGEPLDWFFYVNGIEAGQGAASTSVHPGDRIWWDRHDWSATMHIAAVVGSFPEPFRSGSGGKRLPVRIECARVGGPACDAARSRIEAAGVETAAVAQLGGTAGADVLRVLVGPWRVLRQDPALEQLQRGPRASGVFARPAPDARSIAVLDARGGTVRMLGPGAGLIAATRLGDQQPTWAVTGVDEAGALAAARALTAGALHDRFAAVVANGKLGSAPEVGG